MCVGAYAHRRPGENLMRLWPELRCCNGRIHLRNKQAAWSLRDVLAQKPGCERQNGTWPTSKNKSLTTLTLQ